MENSLDKKEISELTEEIFSLLWYSFLVWTSFFLLDRFTSESWEINYILVSLILSTFIAHIGISTTKYTESKLYLRIGIPLSAFFVIWYLGDFSAGIIKAFQDSLSFINAFLFLGTILASIVVTVESETSQTSIKPINTKKRNIRSEDNGDPFSRIIGQEHVISPLKEIARLSSKGVKVGKENAPYAVLLFLGPTGVGKTEAARALAEAVYGTSDALIRFDMGQFSDAHQASRFYGPPPGYVGYEQGGQLTRAVLKRPRSVVLLDEVEKAHEKVWDAFLPVFDEGYIVDGSSNQKVDMTQTIIVLTSNLLSQIPNLNSKNALQIKEQVEATKVFRPELLGRINEILVFNSLSKEVIREILQRRIDLSLWNLSDRGINVSISSEEIDAMILEVEAAKFGVRQIDDVVRSHIRKLVQLPD